MLKFKDNYRVSRMRRNPENIPSCEGPACHFVVCTLRTHSIQKFNFFKKLHDIKQEKVLILSKTSHLNEYVSFGYLLVYFSAWFVSIMPATLLLVAFKNEWSDDGGNNLLDVHDPFTVVPNVLLTLTSVSNVTCKRNISPWN